MLKACIFDLDGTLADTLDSMAETANEVLTGFGLKSLPVNNYRYYCGEGASMLMRRCLRDAGDPELRYFQEGDRLYREKFNKDPLYRVKIYDGMEETLRLLGQEGAHLAVLSNKPDPAAQKVVRALFGETFDLVVGQSDAIARKPSPDGALYIASKLGVMPAECMYVGDTATDMQTGKNAGMYSVGALWGFRDERELRENKADEIAKKPEDLIRMYRSCR